MNISMRIKRYDPEKESKPYWDEFRVEADPIDRLLDALNTIKWTMDGTPAVLRARRLWVGCDAHQRTQHAGLQNLDP